jgi:hypothetical protein
MHGTPRILDDGTIVYPHRGRTPPPCLDGYRRKAETGSDAWILIPVWKDCPYRTHVIRRREDCQCEILVCICRYPTNNGMEVAPANCEVCTVCPNK